MLVPTISDEFRYQHDDLPVGVLISGLEHVINDRVEDVAIRRKQLDESRGGKAGGARRRFDQIRPAFLQLIL